MCVCGEWERHVVPTSLALFGPPQPCFAPQRVCLSLSHSLPMSLSANFHLRLDGNLCQLEMAICASLRDPASDCRSRAWSAGAWNHFLVACAAEYALCLIVAELRKLADAHKKRYKTKLALFGTFSCLMPAELSFGISGQQNCPSFDNLRVLFVSQLTNGNSDKQSGDACN